ncbi:MAG: hypothetical protein AAF827_11870 [Cyanobacteria bacterium P01_D01_bin.6]
MDSSMSVMCGFLGGTIFSVEGGYQVLQHPRPEKVFERIADARWFLAVNWCDLSAAPAAILTHDGHISFENPATHIVGEAEFLPLEERADIFKAGLSAQSGKPAIYTVRNPNPDHSHQVKIMMLEIDPRYGKVALVQAVGMNDARLERSPF